MVSNVAARRIPPAFGLLLWCALGALLVQLVLWRTALNPRGFSPIFAYLLNAYDAHGNLLLFALVVAAFLLRREPAVLGAARFAGAHPWPIAGAAFVLFCAGSLTVYHNHPLSMDEYLALFQAEAFAGGRLAGRFPPPLLEQLVPPFFLNFFFTVARGTGDVAASYWPGFSILVAPFAWLGVPWAANPLISALSLPALHRLAHRLTGSREAAGWALLLCAASPVFTASAISYYAMPAHLLCSLLYAQLLLWPTPRRALLAGVIGSLALTLHNPVPHLLFAAAFVVSLAVRRQFAALAALLAGYLPLSLLLGFGWQHYLANMAVAAERPAALVPTAPAQAAAAGSSLLQQAGTLLAGAVHVPTAAIIEARIAGLSKIWTWGAAGLLVLAARGFAAARARSEVKLLAAALAITFFGYFLVRFDQGHGWGYRYLHAAWFVLPLLGALAFTQTADAAAEELRNMAGWAVLLSLVAATGLRMVQVESFIARQLRQVPPLAAAPAAVRPEVVFVELRQGAYAPDLVQNDPFLRSPRIVLVYRGAAAAAELMAAHYPGYQRAAAGPWGEHWLKPAAAR